MHSGHKILYHMFDLQTFSPGFCLVFAFPSILLLREEVFILKTLIYQFVLLWIILFMLCLYNLCLTYSHKGFLLIFSAIFYSLGPIYFELILVYGTRCCLILSLQTCLFDFVFSSYKDYLLFHWTAITALWLNVIRSFTCGYLPGIAILFHWWTV